METTAPFVMWILLNKYSPVKWLAMIFGYWRYLQIAAMCGAGSIEVWHILCLKRFKCDCATIR